MPKTRKYRDSLLKALKNLKEAQAYLNTSLEENDPKLFLLALRNVAEAHGGVTKLAKRTKLNRENLYRILSKRGNPELSSLTRLLEAMGLKLTVDLKTRAS